MKPGRKLTIEQIGIGPHQRTSLWQSLWTSPSWPLSRHLFRPLWKASSRISVGDNLWKRDLQEHCGGQFMNVNLWMQIYECESINTDQWTSTYECQPMNMNLWTSTYECRSMNKTSLNISSSESVKRNNEITTSQYAKESSQWNWIVWTGISSWHQVGAY